MGSEHSYLIMRHLVDSAIIGKTGGSHRSERLISKDRASGGAHSQPVLESAVQAGHLVDVYLLVRGGVGLVRSGREGLPDLFNHGSNICRLRFWARLISYQEGGDN